MPPESRRLALASAGAVAAAIGVGWRLDGLADLTQPTLFASFLGFGASGAALGWRIRAHRNGSAARQALGAASALLAWRLAYFPLMVICGWLASVGEWVLWSAGAPSVVYPTFLSLLFALNLAIGWIATAAVVASAPAASRPSAGFTRWLRDPPRPLLWAIGAAALPLAAMVSFSTPRDLVWFGDAPWRVARPIPPIHAPERNPYALILREHELALPSRVLAWNALVTYPLVPESPWGAAMKGTLEALALENPIATSRDRVDEHYLAYLAAQRRLAR
jgi:hypothetical protein